MNYSTAVMLINPNIRAVKITYEPDVLKTDGSVLQKKERIIYKTLDADIKKGDLVVIPTNTRHGMTVVLVDEVDAEVDFESSDPVEWIIDKVSVFNHIKVTAEEGKWIDALKASEKRRKREDLKKNMIDMYQDDGIEKMPIANMINSTAIEHKTE